MIDDDKLDAMTRVAVVTTDNKARAKGQLSVRAQIAARMDKIEAARANGYSLAEIAKTFGLTGPLAAQKLSSYLSSIRKGEQKRAEKRVKRGAPSTGDRDVAQPSVAGLPVPGDLPPMPSAQPGNRQIPDDPLAGIPEIPITPRKG
jgi:hypothetical protein